MPTPRPSSRYRRVVEIYAGEVGAREGVKLGDQVRVTASGSSVLAPHPLHAALLA